MVGAPVHSPVSDSKSLTLKSPDTGSSGRGGQLRRGVAEGGGSLW
jgi:hypothetical protein